MSSSMTYVYGETMGENFNTGATRVYLSKDKKIGLMRTYSNDKLKREIWFPWEEQGIEFESKEEVKKYLLEKQNPGTLR